MLATTPYIFPSPHNFLPKIPSPLSPRSANIYGRPQYTFMSDTEKDKTAQDLPQFSRRPVKKAPSPKQDELKERRRKLFLKKVSDVRDDKRFEARGEDIMRLDFVQRQKQWEAELSREAPPMSFDPVDEEEENDQEQQEYDDDLPGWSDPMRISAPSTQQPWLEDEADEAMQREHAELEALLSYMPADSQLKAQESAFEDFEHLYSDGDDYDALLSELVEQEEPLSTNAGPAAQQQQQQLQQGEAMDTS